MKAPRFFVAELTWRGIADPDHDDNPDSSRAGWCLDRLPQYDAFASKLVRAADRADAEQRLARYAHDGMPAGAGWPQVIVDAP